MRKNIGTLLLVSSALVLASCGQAKKGRDPLPEPINPKDPLRAADALAAEEIRGWELQDLNSDDRFGVSATKAYAELSLKQGKEIVVAVIDGGVDYEHEDLKDVMWVNKKEIPNNNIDDDKNGYIDDIYGWNYIGGLDDEGKPTHVGAETLEVTRIYKSFKVRVDAGETLADKEKELYEEVKSEVEGNIAAYRPRLEEADADIEKIADYSKVLTDKGIIFHLKDKSGVGQISSEDTEIVTIKAEILEMWDRYSRSREDGLEAKLADYKSYFENQINVYFNIDLKNREEIVGDDPSDFSDTKYGNNDVKGPDSSHGTHVAGTIAATRGNEIGMDGIAANVKIMALRAVPNGDERDKDIALAVRYAADNGAHIINMSFGKAYSPYKAEVDAAFKYAAEKGVLLVHAAGNSSKNIDKGLNNYPNSYALEGSGVLAVNTIPNWIEVGASTYQNNVNLIAGFSNFGEEAVTLFAPGKDIYSTFPENEYASISGTSMACPVTSGVAAMLMSEFPEMPAKNAREILMKTVVKVEDDVNSPEASGEFDLPVPFRKFSNTGGVVNAYEAIKFTKELVSGSL